MATSKPEDSTIFEVTTCPICFEKFKTPRYLPCKHSFCHDCLSSYIVSQCKSTEPRLGFHCPICRVYIPSLGDSGKSEEWAGLFPINAILQKLLDQPNERHCEACMRDGDEEEASDFCISCNEYLCKLCTKCHRKNLATRDHIMFTISEMKSNQIVPKSEIENCCPKHQNEIVKLYCYDHEQPCCALCGGTEHRKCERVETIENVLSFLRESGQMDSLLNKMKSYRKKLLMAKTRQEKNLNEIESTADKLVAKAEKKFLALQERIDKMKRVYIDEMFSKAKKGKEMLQREIVKIEDGILCVEHCEAGIEQAKRTEKLNEAMVKFIKAKRKFQQICLLEFSQTSMKISAVESSKWKEFMELNSIAEVKLSKWSLLDFELKKCKEFTITDGHVFNGLFLPERRFLIIDYRCKGPCLIYDKNWECIHINDSLDKPYDAIRIKDELFVTDVSAKTIHVFSLADIQKLRSIEMQETIYGITSFNEMLYIACGDKLIKVDQFGKILQNYYLNGQNTDHIIATNSGLIVYSNWFLETVTAMNDEGRTVWEYKRNNLRKPQELETDSYENIYVAGTGSNNVHVLSNSGDFIRMIEDIQSPYFFKINEDEGIICVCSERKKIEIYHIW